MRLPNCVNVVADLRVQNEQFSEEKGFILRYTEKDVGPRVTWGNMDPWGNMDLFQISR